MSDVEQESFFVPKGGSAHGLATAWKTLRRFDDAREHRAPRQRQAAAPKTLQAGGASPEYRIESIGKAVGLAAGN